MTLIHDILLYPGPKAEYWVPRELAPRTVLDIGANIGLASVYYARLFPEARIYSFEPLPDNFRLLEKNIRGLENVRAFNVGLGRENGQVLMNTSARPDNYGGASMYGVDVDPGQSLTVEVRAAREMLDELGLDQIDLIKIDTEGAEYDILTSIDQQTLFKTNWIIGELHGVNDFKLLSYLAQSFALDVRKTLHKIYFRFNACNKQTLPRIPKHQVKWLQY